MKKFLFLCLIVLLIVVRCSKSSTPDTIPEKIMDHYVTITKTNDTSVIRNEIAELEKLSKDESLNEEERMFAQYTYNVSYGLAKLALSGVPISIFDFPEKELLSATISAVANEETKIEKEMLEESSRFLQKVEKFLQ